MVIYEKYQPFRSWLRKINDKSKISSMARGQAKKSRDGEKFLVIGANGYLGWATVCQLAYKFSGSTIICADKYIGSRDSITKHFPLQERIEKLETYFDFSNDVVEADLSDYEECEAVIAIYRPDFIINLADGNKKNNPILRNILKANSQISNYGGAHIILSTSYNNKSSYNNPKIKITEFKTCNVVGTCNWVTLIDPVLSTTNDINSFVNRMIFDCVNRNKINVVDGYVPVISLEDFTRAIVKIIRGKQKENYDFYFAYDKSLPRSKVATIIKNTFSELGFESEINLSGKTEIIPKGKDKKKFISLIDKHRPPVEYMISYSCKNYLDMRK